MKTTLILISSLLVSTATLAQTTGTNTQIHQQEALQKQRETDRREEALRNESLQPNQKSSPTKVNVDSWGINKDLEFEITNHLFGYSTIIESGQTLHGIKITGLFNFAYYNTEKKSSTGRSQSRYAFGLETPFTNLTPRIVFWGGLGATLGDASGFYLDTGLDYRIANWLKIQGGVNYNLDTGLHPQISVGFVW